MVVNMLALATGTRFEAVLTVARRRAREGTFSEGCGHFFRMLAEVSWERRSLERTWIRRLGRLNRNILEAS